MGCSCFAVPCHATSVRRNEVQIYRIYEWWGSQRVSYTESIASPVQPLSQQHKQYNSIHISLEPFIRSRKSTHETYTFNMSPPTAEAPRSNDQTQDATRKGKPSTDADHPGPLPPGIFNKTSPPLNTENLLVQLDIQKLITAEDEKDFENMRKARRAANYLAASMIFLKDNVDLKEPLSKDHIKDRLLGHWGTCPAITFIYSHCNRLIRKHDLDMFLVTGPGHGAPAVLANLYLEGTLGKFDQRYATSSKGLYELLRGFSWPGGFPSHVNAEVPGAIHEGGELGYALAVSFGAVFDNPDLIVTCIVGDGEAETGPTSTAWHSYKYLDPKESGAVIPILNANGYKIAEPTVFGSMSDEELSALFSGYGYQVRIVENMDVIDADMAASMDWAHKEIRRIQQAARSGNPIVKPRWPMIILRTPKGWTGPKEVHGHQIEGTWRSHQVPLPKVKSDDEEFKALDAWLKSYKFDELFKDGVPVEDVLKTFPRKERMMGLNEKTYAGYKPLDLPDFRPLTKPQTVKMDEWQACMNACGEYLAQVIEKNPKSFRIFSPDELDSNKLSGVFKSTTRNFQWDPFCSNKGGRVIEVLSEHQCQGWMQGYTLTGRVALFPSYEAFLPIITTMVIQYSKFQKVARETNWRKDIGSLNYIESSTLWRQEHNGYSHQNPSFIDALVGLKTNMVRIYLPPDSNTLLTTIDHCLASRNYVNLIISSKQPMPLWLEPEEAIAHCKAGASIWRRYSSHDGNDPDVVLVGCGNETTFEVIAAAEMLKIDAPNLRVRVVNVTDLMILSATGRHPHALSDEEFNALFTTDKPVIFNFHGTPGVVRGLVFDRPLIAGRLAVHGYNQEGTTTTPFKMLTANGCSRFDLAINALRSFQRYRDSSKANGNHKDLADRGTDLHLLVSDYQSRLHAHDKYIVQFGEDPKELKEIPSKAK
ncbi:phosphoketolase [Fimicolochytrium jonesii]|uniref:phosphoketolase n=1 Tax=Fimicolochytrium jonesii TaxID=1396493 RepID=UPI0022FF1947|nr:phosphoketolase [Fimicolochytrium jonesii]KAI8823612.1 phosphoketolase [Fimicolochytrium jonesii]